MSDNDEVELVYFDARGVAEILRLIMTFVGIKYREVDFYALEDFEARKPEALFKQFPLLCIDGMKMVESRSIARYLAKKYGLDGDTPLDAARVDMLFEGSRYFMMTFRNLDLAIGPKEVSRKKITQFGFPRYLPPFEKVLAENGTGYLVGSKVSLADFGLLDCLFLTVGYFTIDALRDFPHLKKFYESMVADPRISNYMQTVRKPDITEEGLKVINDILSYAKCHLT